MDLSHIVWIQTSMAREISLPRSDNAGSRLSPTVRHQLVERHCLACFWRVDVRVQDLKNKNGVVEN